MESKVLLITEKHNIDLVSNSNNEYILEGIFAEFGVKNNNNRIYEESDYLPHLDYLNTKIKSNNLVGELDHPEKFEVSLSNVSHMIENLSYDKDKRQVVGRIKILDTDAGRNAKKLIDGGVKLSISSRSAGIVESNNKVKLRQIFTYDLVANPGFENAGLQRVNESYGFENTENSSINLYDFTDKVSKDFLQKISEENEYINKNNQDTDKIMDTSKFITEEKLNVYSEHVKEEVNKIDGKIDEVAAKINNADSLSEKVDQLIKYANYLAENLIAEKEINSELNEKVTKLVEYTDYLTESVNTENENLQKFTDYLAENLQKGIEFSEYIAENTANNIKYSEYIAENLQKGIEYSEYIAENAQLQINESKSTVGTPDRKERLANINEAITNLVGAIEKQNPKPIDFMTMLTEGEKRDFTSMSDTKKTKVSNILSKIQDLNESIVRDTINEVAKEVELPMVLQHMPESTKKVWENLNESEKNGYIKRSNYYNLDTPAKVTNFWQQQNLKPIELINESQQENSNTGLGYNKDFMNYIKNTKF